MRKLNCLNLALTKLTECSSAFYYVKHSRMGSKWHPLSPRSKPKQANKQTQNKQTNKQTNIRAIFAHQSLQRTSIHATGPSTPINPPQRHHQSTSDVINPHQSVTCLSAQRLPEVAIPVRTCGDESAILNYPLMPRQTRGRRREQRKKNAAPPVRVSKQTGERSTSCMRCLSCCVLLYFCLTILPNTYWKVK